MKIVLSALLFLMFFANVYGQNNQTVSQEFIDDAAKAFQLVIAQRDEIDKQGKQIADLQKLVKTLESSARTPCTIAQVQVKADLTEWLGRLSGDEVKDREILKILKDVRKQGRRAINQQCGVNYKTFWGQVWDGVKVAVPIGVAIWAAND
jgi:hypothetical protein